MILDQQYNWVRETRVLLFSYCEQLKQSDYVKPIASFGGASIRDLHVHVADCYNFWLRRFLSQKQKIEQIHSQPETVQDVRNLFEKVDVLVKNFLETNKSKMETPVKGHVSWKDELFEATPLWLYTHALTHEFHHKGQIVSMSRQLGYTPIETDLIDPELVSLFE